MIISHQFLTRVVFFIFSIFIFIYFLKAFIIEGATKFGWIWMVFRQRWRGKEKRRTLVNLGRNRECQGRNSLRLVFVFAAFYRSRRSYPPFRRYLNEGHPSPLIPLPQFHARRMPQKFPPTSIQKDENTLSPSLSFYFPLFPSKSKVEPEEKSLGFP